jgi:DNA-binding CsgD family transcriptional regulator
MSQQEKLTSDSHFLKWMENGALSDSDPEIMRLSAVRAKAMDEAGAVIARQLNGPLTALLLYMGELKQHSHQLSEGAANRLYLQQVVENALQQTERVCALMKQISDAHAEPVLAPARKLERTGRAKDGSRASSVMFASESGHKPLTRREREVLSLISEGCSNKQGALRMRISPRTFESHRAEAMRKLGARNTADLVRTALMHPSAV